MTQQITTGVFITGAAARIAQEVAMLDLLMQQKGLVLNQSNTLLSGFSSGSLNLLAINVCFRDNNPLSWDGYYKNEVLFTLRNKDVFEFFPRTKDSILNTAPLRTTLNKFLSDAGINYIGDLSFTSNILTAVKGTQDTVWINNGDDGQYALASDVFMSSTAIPVVFPPQTISYKAGTTRNIPDAEFVDGGTHGVFKNFENTFLPFIKQNGPLDTLHIVSPMREAFDEESKGFFSLLRTESLSDAEQALHQNFSLNISIDAFNKFCIALQAANATSSIANNILVSIPFMGTNSGILDFDAEQDVYNTVIDWVKNQHPEQLAVPLEVYVKNNPVKSIITV